MAVSTASPISSLTLRLRRFAQASGRPLFAVVLAMIAGGIVIMITAPGSPVDRFNEAVAAYQALLSGAFGNAQNFSFTLTAVTPLILAGLSVAIAFRARSEEHTSELQSLAYLVCRLLLEKKKTAFRPTQLWRDPFVPFPRST